MRTRTVFLAVQYLDLGDKRPLLLRPPPKICERRGRAPWGLLGDEDESSLSRGTICLAGRVGEWGWVDDCFLMMLMVRNFDDAFCSVKRQARSGGLICDDMRPDFFVDGEHGSCLVPHDGDVLKLRRRGASVASATDAWDCGFALGWSRRDYCEEAEKRGEGRCLSRPT